MSDEIEWSSNNTPHSKRFNDPYFSAVDGRGETRAVFLAGNGLPARWRERADFTIGELGFGTGLNFLETARLWNETSQPAAQLTFVSFEAFPVSHADLKAAFRHWPDMQEATQPLSDAWPALRTGGVYRAGSVTLEFVLGDARECLPNWPGGADAWFLDGFSPAKNPQLWGKDLLGAVARKTAPGGTFSTYTAAGWVRRNLQAAGFDVEKVAGFGGKRERLQGVRRGEQTECAEVRDAS